MKRKRAGALYLQDSKLLLISEGGQDTFWTPGGGLENDETFTEALKRELQEELGATLHLAESFLKIHDASKDEEVEYFLVDISLPEPLNIPGTRMYWYSKEDYENNSLPISKRVYEKVFPRLIALNLV